MQAAEALRDLTRELQAILREVAARENISPTQAQILLAVTVDGTGLSDLAQRLGLDASTISRIITNMHNNKLVVRKPSPEDARVNLVQHTDHGRQVALRVRNALDADFAAALSGMPAPDSESLGQHLEQLVWRLVRHRS